MSTNYESLNIYLVAEGEVSPAEVNTEFDGERSVLVAATSEAGALMVAEAYDRNDIGIDNLSWNGETITVAALRIDGDYV